MSTLPTRIEREAGRRLEASEIVNITAARERLLSRMLMLYISTGVVFMLLPGTFLGVWNLLAISSHRAANSVSPAWIQAHGHAQIFGWIGTFILGIGFYSIPKLRRMGRLPLPRCGALGDYGPQVSPCAGSGASIRGIGASLFHSLRSASWLPFSFSSVSFRVIALPIREKPPWTNGSLS